jgi:hypothetical protein
MKTNFILSSWIFIILSTSCEDKSPTVQKPIDTKNILKLKKNTATTSDSLVGKGNVLLKIDYDYDDGRGFYEFKEYSRHLILKEKNRISQSKYASRNKQLTIKLLNGNTLNFSNTSKYEIVQTYYSYLFEEVNNSKLYVVKINYSGAGGGYKSINLIEIDLTNGKAQTIEENSGGDFYFNANNSFLITTGWHESEEYAKDCDLKLINLKNFKKELSIEKIEPVEIRWNSLNEFECILLKYSKEKEWPHTRIPSKIRTGKIHKFSLEGNNWVSKKME